MLSLESFSGKLLTGSFVLFTGLRLLATDISAAEKIAIKGYDTVAYFTEGKAQMGTDALTYRWHGMTWHFSSQEYKKLFIADPEKYAPQYDGYCAWALTEKRLAITDPEVWKIVDGKLYLNCSQAAYEKWSRDIPGHIKEADKHWQEMQKGK